MQKFGFDFTPKFFHRAIIDAFPDTIYALFDLMRIHDLFEVVGCVLPPITVHQRGGIRVLVNCRIKYIKHKLIIG